ncbi:sulfatase-like hydrolase/transferase [Clostridium sp. MCC353]|uniref:sulfatase family protein n=1 Tax=Clostridium sp. MCC353 TaxID=2592646 RepID=UPI001C01199D|nr:sulfatase-like hydrolase/transferase [Clostridium sp. MCC353]
MRKPNIVYMFCDELRCDALSCYPGAPKGIQTPNLDRLAQTGTLFENCFCNSPVCVPSRYSLLTGLYPETTGVYHNEAAKENYAKKKRFLTIPQVFKAQGYQTANFGKQHLPKGVEPFGVHNPEGSKIKEPGLGLCTDIIATKGIKSPIGGIFPPEIPYPPNAVTHNAIQWMKEQDAPYMVRISWLQPHTPVVPLPHYAFLYDWLDFPVCDMQNARLSRFEQKYIENVNDGLSENEARRAKACYYGLVRWVDDQVGMIISALEEQGLLDDTILLFGADHGVMLGENHRYAKQNFACWSHRVPLIISYGKKLASGVRRKDICENLDLGKTLFSLAGIQAPGQFRGRDLFSEETAEYVYATIGYGDKGSFTFPNKKCGLYTEGRGWPMRSCIRSLDYRFDMNIRIDGEQAGGEDEDMFLADLRKDPAEQFNVADREEYAGTVLMLREKLLAHINAERARGEA